MPDSFFLGIDGGGTSCRARIRDAAGVLRGQAQGGSANIHQDFDAAMANILATARQAAAAAGIGVENLQAGLGLAGATGPEQCARVLAADLPFATLQVDSDGYAACLGAPRGGDGGIVIVGTGSAGFALVQGQRIGIGGHGFALGDQGSGAVIGREVLACSLLAHDGLGEASPLTLAIMAHFGEDPGRAIAWSRTAMSRDYARFAPQAIAAAAAGDAIGLGIARQAALGLGRLLQKLRHAGAPRLCLIGGLAKSITPFLSYDSAGLLAPALADAVDGAIFMARMRNTQAGIGVFAARPHRPC